jgi:hypothetical protein
MSRNDPKQFARFLEFIKEGNATEVERMINSTNIDPSAEDNKAIKAAIIIGHNDIVELLLNDLNVQNSVNYEALKKLTDDKEIIDLLDYFSASKSDSESESKDIKKPSIDEEFKKLLYYIKVGDSKGVKRILEEGKVDPSLEDNKAIKLLASYGYGSIILLLLKDPRVRDTINYEELIRIATNAGNKKTAEIIEDLKKYNESDSKADSKQPKSPEKKKTPELKKSKEELFKEFLIYVKYSNVEEVKRMVKEGQVDPSMGHNEATEVASEYGRNEIIEFLLMDPRVATTVDYSQMQQTAFDNKNWKSVKLITELTNYNQSDPERVKELEDFKQGKLKGELKELKKEPVNFNDLLNYIQTGNLRVVKNILDEGRVDPSAEDNKAIKKATELGYIEIIQTLLNNDRIMNTIDYDEIIKIAIDKGNKRIAQIIGNIAVSNKRIRKKRRESIAEYKTIRKVVKQAELAPEIEFDDFKGELKNIDIIPSFVEDVKTTFKRAFVPIITVVKKDVNIKDNVEFKSFLCEMETFKWSANEQAEDYETHRNRRNIGYNGIYPTYTIHLVKMLGNNITLFTMNTISSTQSDYLSNHGLRRLKIKPDDLSPDYDNSKHRIFNFPKPLVLAPGSLTDALSDINLPKYELFPPLFFREFKKTLPEKFLYTCHYCEEIKTGNTRYALVNCIYMYIHGGVHYTFLFIDHKDKILEYYDPEIYANKKTGILFTYKALQTIFPGYKINNFWRLSSIQKTEQYEKDEKGFCVKWGHMILHLKLLNINMSVGEIEALLIKECETKNMSLYELVLNYTYLMKRIIPSDMDKMLKLKMLLMK